MNPADVDAGPMPEDSLPGHHPDHEQDQPDLAAMAERLGTVPPEARVAADEVDDGGEGGDERSLVELVEANVAAGVHLGAGLVKGGLAAGSVVAGSAVRQAGRRVGLSR